MAAQKNSLEKASARMQPKQNLRESLCPNCWKTLTGCHNDMCILSAEHFWKHETLEFQMPGISLFYDKSLLKIWIPAFSPFPIKFSTLFGTISQFQLPLNCCLHMLSILEMEIWTSLIDYKLLKRVKLTQYHTIPHFDELNIYSCGKHCEKRRNCL